jgi:hypothetical protein
VQIHGIKRFGVSVLVALGLVTAVYPGAAPANAWAAPSTVTTINPRVPRVLFHAEDSTVVFLAQAGAASLWLGGQLGGNEPRGPARWRHRPRTSPQSSTCRRVVNR